MLQLVSVSRRKRLRRRFEAIVECTGLHEPVATPTLMVDRRNRAVVVSLSEQTTTPRYISGKVRNGAIHAPIGLLCLMQPYKSEI